MTFIIMGRYFAIKTHLDSLTIIPVKLFLNAKGLAKLEIAIAKGKKLFDKRETIKAKDVKRQLDRVKKSW